MIIFLLYVGVSLSCGSFNYKNITKKDLGKLRDTKAERIETIGKIVPGVGADGVLLGENFESVVKRFGAPFSDVNHEFADCKYRTAKWILRPKEKRSGLVFVTFSNENIIIEIQIQGDSKLRTVEGIRGYYPSNTVRETLKDLSDGIDSYVDTGQDYPGVGFVNHWIDFSRGISYQFAWNRVIKVWEVNAIYVFPKNQKGSPGYIGRDCGQIELWKYRRKLGKFELSRN